MKITSASVWNAEAEKIRQYNKAHDGAPKRLPSIDLVKARGWMLTINAEKHEKAEVDRILGSIPTAAVYSREAGSKTGYEHFQSYMYFENPRSGKSVRALFDNAHCEPARKPAVACAAYCSKDRTHLEGPFWLGDYTHVAGMAPTTEQTARKDKFAEAQQRIEDGWRFDDFLDDDEWLTWALRHKDAIENMLAHHVRKTFGEHDRDMSVDYIHGPAGSYKSRSIRDLYGRGDVFAANLASTDFPFDGYEGQSVLLLDDFRSSIKFDFLLRILDPYPFLVSVKGGHAWAQWTKVIITANISLTEQYPNLSERKDPLLRRFEHGIVFEKTSPAVALPYASREDAMKGIRNDGGTNGVPGYTPMWEREQNAGGFSDADFDALLN
jgi:hypothetical protein